MGAKRWARFVVDGGAVNLDKDLELRTLQGRAVLARDCTPEMVVIVQTVAGPVQASRYASDWRGGESIDGTFVDRDERTTALVLNPTELRKRASQGRVTLRVARSSSSIALEWAPSVRANVRQVLQRMVLQITKLDFEGRVVVNALLGTIAIASHDDVDPIVTSIRSFLAEHNVEVQVEQRE